MQILITLLLHNQTDLAYAMWQDISFLEWIRSLINDYKFSKKVFENISQRHFFRFFPENWAHLFGDQAPTRGYSFFMPNSTEPEILITHENQNAEK